VPEAPLVDVGIPTYGRPRFLAEAIESVVRQTHTSWTLTISENGPRSDYVSRIVEPYVLDARVRHVATGKDLGAARNHTSLIEAGSAPYVAILNDDDRWRPEFLEVRVACLEEHRQCALAFSTCDFIDENGRELFRYELGIDTGVQDQREFLRTLYDRCLICMPTVLVARWAYEAVGPRFDDSVLFYDHEMWLRLAARFPVAVLPTCDAEYRVHGSQVTQRSVRLHVGERKLEVLDAVDKALPPDFPALDRRRARFVALTRGGFDAFGRGESREGLHWLTRAVRAHPGGVVDPEILRRVARRLRQRNRDREFWSVGLTEQVDAASEEPPRDDQRVGLPER
jgi:glycosyltransferase involved in cell wall biosynthesis